MLSSVSLPIRRIGRERNDVNQQLTSIATTSRSKLFWEQSREEIHEMAFLEVVKFNFIFLDE
jgi:hypothetical protein